MMPQMITHEDLEASLLNKLLLLTAVADDSSVGIQSDAKTIMTLLVDELIKDDAEQEGVSKELSDSLKDFLKRDPEVIASNMSSYVKKLHEKLSEASARVSVKQDSIINQISTSKQLESLSTPVSSSSQSAGSARQKRPDIKIEVETDGEIETHRWGGYGRRPQVLYDILGEANNDPKAVKSLRESVELNGTTSGNLPSGSRYTLSIADDGPSA